MVFTALRGLPDDMPLATVTLRSAALDVATATRVVGVEPDLAASIGGPMFRRKDGSYSKAPTGTWMATTAGRVPSYLPAEHLAWVVYRIGKEVGPLRDLWPDLEVAFSLLTHENRFAVATLPVLVVRRARSLGEVAIEAPEAGVDVILKPTTGSVSAASSAMVMSA